MKKEDQIIAIAKACRLDFLYPLKRRNRKGKDDPNGVVLWYCAEAFGGSQIWDTVPDYLNSLDAMQKAVISLPDDKQGDFRRHLEDVIRGRKLGHQKVGISLMGKEEYTRWFNATASQRAEAFLRTLNLWQPEPERRGGGE